MKFRFGVGKTGIPSYLITFSITPWAILFIQTISWLFPYKQKNHRGFQIACFLTLYHTIPTFNNPEKKKNFKDIVGKGGNAGNQHFKKKNFKDIVGKGEMLVTSISSFSYNVFCPSKKKKNVSSALFILSSAKDFNLDWSKIFSFGKELSNIMSAGNNGKMIQMTSQT